MFPGLATGEGRLKAPAAQRHEVEQPGGVCRRSCRTTRTTSPSEVNTRNEMELAVARVIDNIAGYRNATSLLAQLKLVSAALQRLQQDSCTLGDGVNVWINLLETAELEPYRPIILKRFQQWLTPTHSAAYLTHTRYKGRGLAHDQEEEAQKWLAEKDRSFLAPLSWFLIEDEKLPQSMFVDEVVKALEPDAWWRLIEKKQQRRTRYHRASCL